MAGRPSSYTKELADKVCQAIADGNSVRKVCAMKGMPSMSSVFKWLGQHAEFAEQYARACNERREVRKEQLLDIPTDPDIDPQRGRLLSDNIKWVLAKEEPKKYGDKLAVGGADDLGPIRSAAELTDDQLAAVIAGKK